LPFINRHSYHSFGLSSSDIRQIPGDFEPRIAPSTAAAELAGTTAEVPASRKARLSFAMSLPR